MMAQSSGDLSKVHIESSTQAAALCTGNDDMRLDLMSMLLERFTNSRLGEYSGAMLAKVQDAANSPFGLDMTIEGLNKYKYSVAIFVFLVMQVMLFSFMIFVYVKKTKRSLKTGEKWMFGALILGIVFGLTFGWTQMIEGYLF